MKSSQKRIVRLKTGEILVQEPKNIETSSLLSESEFGIMEDMPRGVDVDPGSSDPEDCEEAHFTDEQWSKMYDFADALGDLNRDSAVIFHEQGEDRYYGVWKLPNDMYLRGEMNRMTRYVSVYDNQEEAEDADEMSLSDSITKSKTDTFLRSKSKDGNSID